MLSYNNKTYVFIIILFFLICFYKKLFLLSDKIEKINKIYVIGSKSSVKEVIVHIFNKWQFGF